MCWLRLYRLLLASVSVAGALALIGSLANANTPSADTTAISGLAQSPAVEAAQALRSGNCDLAAARLARYSTAATTEPLEEEVLLGLYAHACQRYSASLEHLRSAEGYTGPLADWRLSSIAESAASLGQIEAARDSLSRLVREYPESPLLRRSVVEAIELAVQGGDLPLARDLIEDGAELELDPELDQRLQIAAWKLASELLDDELERSAARALLVRHPLRAAELEVVEVFRHPSGELKWTKFLSRPEVLERCRGLIAADLPAQAVSLLEQAAPADRDLEWTLVMGEALTEDHRGVEALDTLLVVEPQPTEDEIRVEWLRARASLEASRARKGGTLTSDERRQMRARAHEHLRRLLGLGAERQLAIRALRILFSDLAEAERFEEAIEILQALQSVDPSDTTGARYLWRLGWSEFDDRNYSSAVGYWTELGKLYPGSSYTRAGLYWSARGHRALGNDLRADEMLRRVAQEDFPDFYRQHALQQVDSPAETHGGPEVQRAEWPRDPLLARAGMLTEIGLDEAALTELGLLAASAEPRAANALHSQILANQGKVRDSIIALRRAFPELGTPAESRAPERARRLYYPLEYSEIIESHAKRQALPAHLVFGMIRQESAFDASARSWAGARGLMQVMPATGRELAQRMGLRYSRERLSDPGFSVQLGTAYFRQVLRMFDGNQQLALAGYNAGPYRIKRLWKQAGTEPELDRFLENLPMEETKTYVKRVTLYAGRYRDLYDTES
ncbi:MAG: lytic transglycosylase domain-containing protein [Acidobacteriota bacterium]|nr:lytic transglycosylase domain-containing protein [Acidobacteriota bacterium]